MADLYQILGVDKKSSAQEIKKAYRSLALKWHPDKNKDPQAQDKFKEINKAYEILSEPQKRKLYDTHGEEVFRQGSPYNQANWNPSASQGTWGPFTYSYTNYGNSAPFEGFDFGGFSDPFDIFEQFFGGASPFSAHRQRSRSVYKLNISFMEACKGVQKQVNIEGQETKIKIPPGVSQGTRIRYKDYDIVIAVGEDKKFRREGQDIVSDVKASLLQVILGGNMEVDTIDGPLMIRIQPGTQPDTLIRLKGKGVPHVKSNLRGDHYLRIKVEIPSKITKRQKELLAEFEKENDGKSGWF